MLDKHNILEVLRQNRDMLRTRYQVQSIGLFGSFVRDGQREGSDIDLLVEFAQPITLFQFIRLEDCLSELLGRQVDLVMKSALKPGIGERILQEVTYQ